MKIPYKLIETAFVFTACLLLPVFSNGQPGTLDPTFGAGGTVTTNFVSSDAVGRSVALQSDGKIIVAGYTASGPINDYEYLLVRYNSDGNLDSTFGSAGKVITSFGFSIYSVAFSVAIQSDGKIVVAGTVIIRYNSDGSVDGTFGSNGIVTPPIYIGDAASSVTIQVDEKIVIAGKIYYGSSSDFAVVRYNNDGSLDSTFGTGGITSTAIGSADDMAKSVRLQTDGKIVVAGNTNNGTNQDFALVRYNNNGSLDTTFGSGGLTTTDFSSNDDDWCYSVAIDNIGKIVLAGYTHNGTNIDYALSRYNSDGSLDSTFDTDGKVNHCCGYGYSVAIQSDYKIVEAGLSYLGSFAGDFGLMRLNSDGSLDNTFGSAGIVTTDFANNDDWCYSVAIQSDGKIVAAGYGYIVPSGDFAVARYNGSTVSITENGAEENKITFSPNPFTTSTTLTNQSKFTMHDAQLKIYDMTGREVSKYEIRNQKTEISRKNLSSGIYFYKVQNKTELIGSGKLIVQ